MILLPWPGLQGQSPTGTGRVRPEYGGAESTTEPIVCLDSPATDFPNRRTSAPMTVAAHPDFDYRFLMPACSAHHNR